MKLFVDSPQHFLKRQNSKDKRCVEYCVVDFKKNHWVDKNTVIELIENGFITNAKVVGNKIVYVKPKLNIEKINTVNYLELMRFARAYSDETRKRMNEDLGYYSDDLMYIEGLLNSEYDNSYLFKNSYLVRNGNMIIGIYSVVENQFGKPIVYNNFSSDWNLIYKSVCLLSKKIKDSIFYFDYAPDEFYGSNSRFKPMNFKSTLDSDKEYHFYHGSYLTEYDENAFRDYIEKQSFPEITDFSKVEVKCIEGKDMPAFCKKWWNIEDEFQGTWGTHSSYPTIVGFHYFSNEDIYNSNNTKYPRRYIVALINNMLVGVIKIGVYQDHQSVAYIDVHQKYRNHGIATKMIKEVNKYVYKNYPMCLTTESEIGAICHMADKFKKAITKVTVKTYDEALNSGTYY